MHFVLSAFVWAEYDQPAKSSPRQVDELFQASLHTLSSRGKKGGDG
jgi:hypothetical protein